MDKGGAARSKAICDDLLVTLRQVQRDHPEDTVFTSLIPTLEAGSRLFSDPNAFETLNV